MDSYVWRIVCNQNTTRKLADCDMYFCRLRRLKPSQFAFHDGCFTVAEVCVPNLFCDGYKNCRSSLRRVDTVVTIFWVSFNYWWRRFDTVVNIFWNWLNVYGDGSIPSWLLLIIFNCWLRRFGTVAMTFVYVLIFFYFSIIYIFYLNYYLCKKF